MQCAIFFSTAETLTLQKLLPSEPQNCWTLESLGNSVMLPVHCSRCTLTSIEETILSQLYCKQYTILDPSNAVMSTIYSSIVLCNKQLYEHTVHEVHLLQL